MVYCIGPLDYPYPNFHFPDFLNIFYPLLSFIGFLYFLLYSTPLSFFPCIHTCYKLIWTKNSMARGIERIRTILGWIGQSVLKIE